jgi:membrane protein
MGGLLESIKRSYPVAVVERFFALELLDKTFALAAQVFVALLPLVIVIVSLFTSNDTSIVAEQIIDRFGLVGAASVAVRNLFTMPDHTQAISWLAIIISLISAFSLSRRLSRTYALIFRLTPLPPLQYWRALVWIGLQVVMLIGASFFRDVARTHGWTLWLMSLIALLGLWVLGDYLGYRLLVPTLQRSIMYPSICLAVIGRVGIAIWAGLYMPATLSNQANQFGAIGVTFSLFTYFLVAVAVLLLAPLLVVVWRDRHAGLAHPVSEEQAP